MCVLSSGLALTIAQPAGATDLAIQMARVEGSRVHVAVRNDGTAHSTPLSLALTTRAGGFMVGAAAHPLPALAPGARHQVELPLPIWAPHRSDLLSVIAEHGCCTTRVLLLPDAVEVEISHPLPLPVEQHPPPARKEPQ